VLYCLVCYVNLVWRYSVRAARVLVLMLLSCWVVGFVYWIPPILIDKMCDFSFRFWCVGRGVLRFWEG